MWRIVPPTPVLILPVGVWVKSATLISNDKNAAERKINPSGSREQSEKELYLQSLNVTQCRQHNTHNARMVVVAETPTRFVTTEDTCTGVLIPKMLHQWKKKRRSSKSMLS